MSPGSLPFGKLVRNYVPANKQAQANLDPRLSLFVPPQKKSAGDARCASQDPSTHPATSPIKSRLKSVLGSVLPTWNAMTYFSTSYFSKFSTVNLKWLFMVYNGGLITGLQRFPAMASVTLGRWYSRSSALMSKPLPLGVGKRVWVVLRKVLDEEALP